MSDEDIKSIGSHIREKVIPQGMSVKDAAEKLGVGRPALSNLLNGKASLSPEMALRLEKAFGADRQRLLDLQARLDQAERREEDKEIAVSAYVPRFLTITARQIEQWADGNLEARRDLPVLLRRLIHATGRELREVDFPGYDNAERKGWDGWVEAAGATPWIPDGHSGWEFGTSQDRRAKANSDYAARLKSVPEAERAEITFVFVTPRNWNGKQEWAREKNAAGDWKAVRALDASDLEQWLETSISPQIWLAEKLPSIPTEGFETLDEAWHRWCAASAPPMTPAIFQPSITAHRGTLKEWLDKPSERPFIVAADSTDEALAFLACLFRDDEIAARVGDLAAIFESAQTLKTLASSTSPFIPIVSSEEAERALAGVYRRIHCIVVRPRNAVNSEPDIALDLLNHEDFEKALAAMGIDRDAADQLGRESGRSPTILRRRLSRIEAIRTPLWARDDRVAKALIPMALVGAWHTRSKVDCEVMSVLADRPYPEIEETIAHLRQFDDSPVWSVGQYRGVASKMDALFAVRAYVTEKQQTDFLLLAEYVLSEQDPALELPEDQQWAAAIYGKVRDHSGVLREGICETLVILAVHGNNLFRDRLGFDAEAHVSRLIRQLLTPFTLDKLLSHEHDLPRYAEAAPDEFLTQLENDLQQPEPVLLGLLKPVSAGVFGRCPRTGLLWALECLAWKPQNLGRVTAVLAQLSRIRIDDNWANKPIASLEAIFRSWMPQTAASLEDRIRVLEMLAGRFPDIAWQICIEQFSPGHRVGTYSYRPHWRSDASGAGQPVTRGEMYELARKALTLAIGWPDHDERTLGDLVERLGGMAAEDQVAVWDLVDTFSEATPDDRARAALRERIRRFVFTRQGRHRDLNEATRDRARAAYDNLTPADLTLRHAWLFANQWVEESADELEDEAFDLTKRQERMHKLRLAAIKEIWAARGFAGVSSLLEDSNAPAVVGYFAGLCATGETELIEILRTCLDTDADRAAQFDAFMAGCIESIAPDRRGAVLQAVAREVGLERAARLLRCAPFGEHTWRLLDQQGQEIRDRYWREVYPRWNRLSEAEVTELIDRLLEAQRPRAAFNVVHMDWQKVETSRLKRLLFAVAGSNAEPAGSFQLNTYEISAALDELGRRAGVTRDEMAGLEFVFIRALDHSQHGIPNLEQQVTKAPAMFVQAVAVAYKRSDNGRDPPEWQVDDEEHRHAVAMAAHHLLDQLHRVPGTNSDGKVDTESLRQWVTEARRLCAEHGRADIGDQLIGQLLSRAPSEEGGLWPCRAVCEVMESVAAEHIGRGFHIGVINARGVHMRGPGGDQERELAAKYRNWAQQLAHEYPYVSSVVESIALSYDRDAEREDADAMVSKRLRGWA